VAFPLKVYSNILQKNQSLKEQIEIFKGKNTLATKHPNLGKKKSPV